MRVERKISGGGGTVNHLGQPVSLNYDDHSSATFDHGATASPTNDHHPWLSGIFNPMPCIEDTRKSSSSLLLLQPEAANSHAFEWGL